MSDDVKPNEINNKVLISIMVITMIISLGGTFLIVSKMSSLQPKQVVYTGLATSDIGSARIEIEDTLSIDVDAGNGSIDFGTCIPPTNPNTNASISSQMTKVALNLTGMTCGGTINIPKAIVISNVGNIPANITVTTSMTGSTLLGGTSRGEFYYKSTNATVNGGCGASKIQATYAKFASTITRYNVCKNLTTTAGNYNKVYFWANLTVPNDAKTSGSDTATLTFYGTQI
jgi:hypothetical protein